MKRGIFYTPIEREIAIEISDEHIAFFFEENVRRQKRWASEQEELGNEVSEEDKKVYEFYWIDKQHWIRDKTNNPERGDNWHNHMRSKVWFTNEMYDFINRNTNEL